jgi:hypothetical protein
VADEALKARGLRILPAIRWPSGADIDHLAIGPAGVFTVNRGGCCTSPLHGTTKPPPR